MTTQFRNRDQELLTELTSRAAQPNYGAVVVTAIFMGAPVLFAIAAYLAVVAVGFQALLVIVPFYIARGVCKRRTWATGSTRWRIAEEVLWALEIIAVSAWTGSYYVLGFYLESSVFEYVGKGLAAKIGCEVAW